MQVLTQWGTKMDIGAIQSGGWDIGALQYVQQGGGTNYGDISGSTSISLSSSAFLLGIGSISGTAQIDSYTSAQMSGVGKISGSSNIQLEAVATVFDGMLGGASMTIDTDGTLFGVSNLSGSAQIQFSATGRLSVETEEIITPPSRIIKIPFENRAIKIPFENRTIKIK
jgi:hypothetical protein